MQHQKLDPASVHDTPANVSDLLNLHEIVARRGRTSTRTTGTTSSAAPRPRPRCGATAWRSTSIALRPRVLRDVSNVDASTTQFGRKLRLPVLFAPVGSLESFQPAGAASVVRGGRRVRRRPHAELGVRPGT